MKHCWFLILLGLSACPKPEWKSYPPDWMEMCWNACQGPFDPATSKPDTCVCTEEVVE